jgi:DNA repair protein REV1
MLGQGSSSGDGEAGSSDGLLSRIFEGTNCYINGHTDPPYAELRRLLLLHGGEHMVYLDTKSPCTHIIASSLTPKKRIEFRDYRTVRPEWVTASIAAGRMLDWRRFRCDATAAGAMDFGAAAGSRLPGSVRGVAPTPQGAGSWRSAGAAAAASQVASSSSHQQRQSDAVAAATRSVRSDVQSAGNADPWGRASAQTTLAAAVLRGKRHALPEPAEVAAQAPASPTSEQPASGDASSVAGEWEPTTPPRSSQSKEADLSPASWLAQLETPPKKAAEEVSSTAERLESRNAMLGGTPPPSSALMLAEGEPTQVPLERGQPIERAGVERRNAMPGGTPPPSSLALLAEGEATQAPSKGAHDTATTPARPSAASTLLLARPSPNAAKQTAAAQTEQTARQVFSSYASRPSNASAARLLSSPSWRKENTATSTAFLAGYYGKSRLHHLSTWKLELQDMVGQAMRESGRAEGSRDLPPGVGRVIMHVDVSHC